MMFTSQMRVEISNVELFVGTQTFYFTFFSADTREELDFMLDEEMEELNLQKRSFTKWDSDSEDDITDADVRKIIIVVQVIVQSRSAEIEVLIELCSFILVYTLIVDVLLRDFLSRLF